MSFKILGTGSYAPEHVVTNDDLSALVDTNDEWITQRIGVRSRHISETETNVDMAVKAAERALENAGISADELDLIIATTITGDTLSPGTGCMVQNRIGAHCPAFDLAAACSGFLFALETAAGFLSRGAYNRVLVVSAERMSGIIDWTDRGTCCIFGDGAGAVVLKASSDPGILAARMYADGDYGEKVLSLTASLNHGVISGDPYIRMDGRQVFRLAVEGLVGSAREVADLACVHTEDVALFVPHQANLRIMTMVAAKLGIPEERMVRTVAEHGNTSAASVPLALDRAVRAGMVKPGELVLLQGVGAGMAWGSALIRW